MTNDFGITRLSILQRTACCYVNLSPTRNQAITDMFLAELREKHLVDDALFFVDSAPWLQVALHRHNFRFRYENTGIGTASNVSFEN